MQICEIADTARNMYIIIEPRTSLYKNGGSYRQHQYIKSTPILIVSRHFTIFSRNIVL